jgi:hypothetical protein
MPSAYQRLHLNQWCAGEDRLTNETDLEQCITLAGPLPFETGRRYLICADIGVTNDASVVAVTHAEPILDDGGELRGRRLVLDQLKVWRGTRKHPVQLPDVEAQIVEFARQFPGASAVLDPHEAVSMMQTLRAKGVQAEPFLFTTTSVGRLGIGLFQAIRAHRLAIWRDEALVEELLNVKPVERTPGNYRLDHSASGHDDMAVCLAMGVVTLLERPAAHPEIIFAGPTEGFAPDGSALQVPVGPGGKFAMDPADAYFLDRLGDGSW